MQLSQLISRIADPRCLSPGQAELVVTDICADSRAAAPGCLFVAVSGRSADGVAFARDAVARGAIAVVADASAALELSVPIIRVADARLALARLAARLHGLDELQAGGAYPAIAITGTNGKSTTAYMIRGLLQVAGRLSALLGTIEYDLVGRKLPSSLTTPDPVTLTRHLVEARGAGAEAIVMEASSHSLDQRRTDGVRFDVGIFTNLTQDHLDYHASLEDYLLAKKRLFDGLDARATAVVNADDPAAARMVQNCRARVIRYGLDGPADLRARVIREDNSGCRFVLEHGQHAVEMFTPMVGRHNVYNALAAIAAAAAIGVDMNTIRAGLAAVDLVPGRLQRVPTAGLGFDIFVDYAHTDDALRNVLRAVRPLTRGRLWCVFGCGGDRDRTKRPLMARAVADLADHFVITSDNPRTEDPLRIIADIERGLPPSSQDRRVTIPDRRLAIGHAVNQLAEGDALIIAGKGHEDYQIIGTTKHHFDDVEVTREAVARREAEVHATAHPA